MHCQNCITIEALTIYKEKAKITLVLDSQLPGEDLPLQGHKLGDFWRLLLFLIALTLQRPW